MGSSSGREGSDDGEQDSRRGLKAGGLSKSRYTTGLQCHRRLWWTVHERDAPELVVGPELQAVFDTGNQVGELARTYFPGSTLIDLPHWQVRERVEATRVALAAGAPSVCEASFTAGDVFVAVDVLHRAPGRRGWTVTEVKSTLSVKDEHVPDVAVQAHVVRAAGLPVSRAEVMHLNRDCRHPDLSSLFVRADVTKGVKAALRPSRGRSPLRCACCSARSRRRSLRARTALCRASARSWGGAGRPSRTARSSRFA